MMIQADSNPLFPKFPGQPEHKKPLELDIIKMENEVRALIEKESLDIYTKMCNNGYALRDALAAVYISGMNARYELGKEEEDAM